MDTEVMEDTMVDSEATTEERGLLMPMPLLLPMLMPSPTMLPPTTTVMLPLTTDMPPMLTSARGLLTPSPVTDLDTEDMEATEDTTTVELLHDLLFVRVLDSNR